MQKTTYSTVLPPGLRSRSTPEFGKVLSRSTEGTPPFFKSGGLHSIQILDPCSRLHSFHFKNIQFQEPNPDLRNKPRSIFDRFYFDHVFFPKALSENRIRRLRIALSTKSSVLASTRRRSLRKPTKVPEGIKRNGPSFLLWPLLGK